MVNWPDQQKDSSFSAEKITLRGKSPKDVQADLLAGEPDDLAIDFTNVIDYQKGGSN
ncbi:hypothetical protein [Caproiciproducens faecalis]|uniref:Uncharacterized protein n=1 Tax=Caproiciproducens faecalis TaxID=2820301 RepID=A0ABS7DQN5_9FIRM|nr:hypothetical protein [Caproiciproducens faecalis]MBW7573607.1 hypothetical protein [Caproiciproducens faecalis]